MTKRTLFLVAMLFALASPGVFADDPFPTCGPCGQKSSASATLKTVIRVALPMVLSSR